MSGRGPSDKEVDYIADTVKDIKQAHPQLKFVPVWVLRKMNMQLN